MSAPSNMLEYDECNFLRQRLILATLSGKPVKIKRIRHKHESIGLKECEASFIRLLDKLQNGTRIDINETGTRLVYIPGMLHGGTVEHDCNVERGIGYYMEALVCLAPFMKNPLKATLRGVTNNQIDPSVDFIKGTTLPVLKRFLLDDEQLELKIIKRGMPPGGGGEVQFTCPNKQKLRPLILTDPGKIKRIRGIAHAVRIAPTIANRVLDAARGVLNKFVPDVYIYTDHMRGQQSGKSPGFGLALFAESTAGVFLGAEMSSSPASSGLPPTIPEDLGKETAHLLLDEIYNGGCVDSSNQFVPLLYMVLGQQDVSKIVMGQLTPYTIEHLRHIRDFFQVMFKIEPRGKDEEDLQLGGEKLMLTCVGAGFSHLSKTVI